MKSILVIFAVLGMAAQTHAQTFYTCNDQYWINQGYSCSNNNSPDPNMNLATEDVASQDDFLIMCCLYSCTNDNTAGYTCPANTEISASQYFEDNEENFQNNCCFTDCEAVQGSFTCPDNNFQGSSIINYGLVTDQLSFQNNCCYTSCLQHSLQCSPGLQYNSEAATLRPPDDLVQMDFDISCCEEIQPQSCEESSETCSSGTKTANPLLTYTDNFQDSCCDLSCAEFQQEYNDRTLTTLVCENVMDIGDFGDLAPLLIASTATDSTKNYAPYSAHVSGSIVSGNLRSEQCCECNVGAFFEAGGSEYLISASSYIASCRAYNVNELPYIKEATDAAGTALTSTCAVASP
jgi:hypothetical protein